MSCDQCQTKHTYNITCHDCGVRLILSAWPVADRARAMTDYIKAYYKADPSLIINEAREKWKSKKGEK